MRNILRILVLAVAGLCVAPQAAFGEVATSVGLGFSVGPININLVEISIPWSIFSRKSSRGSGSDQVTIYGRGYNDQSWYSYSGGGGSSTSTRPKPTIVEVDLNDVVPKKEMQIRLGLLFDEDRVTCPNGQELRLLEDGSMQLVGSSPGVVVKKHFNDKLTIWNAEDQPLAMISEHDDHYVVDYMNSSEALKAIELVLGVSLGVV